jgi:ribosome biogenesis GTPase A
MRVKYSFSSRRTGNISNIKKQREKFPKIVLNMLRICDIILEVLDARFIGRTRNLYIEDKIARAGKKLIYIINKIDLVNREELKKELREKNIYPYALISCKKRIGGVDLRNIIKIEAKRVKTRFNRIQVGIIGYPNTGKSSLINFLTGSGSAKTGKQPGFTKGMQKIKLTAGILLIDTPGVIPDIEYSDSMRENVARHAIVNARSYNDVKEPEFIVHKIMQDFPEILDKYYNINSNGDAEILIESLGKKKLFLIKGGLVDVDRTARFILRDWQEGKIRAK